MPQVGIIIHKILTDTSARHAGHPESNTTQFDGSEKGDTITRLEDSPNKTYKPDGTSAASRAMDRVPDKSESVCGDRSFAQRGQATNKSKTYPQETDMVHTSPFSYPKSRPMYY